MLRSQIEANAVYLNHSYATCTNAGVAHKAPYHAIANSTHASDQREGTSFADVFCKL